MNLLENLFCLNIGMDPIQLAKQEEIAVVFLNFPILRNGWIAIAPSVTHLFVKPFKTFEKLNFKSKFEIE